MTRPSKIPRPKLGLILTLIGLMAGFMGPGYCQVRPLSTANEVALLTSTRWVPTGNLNTARYGHTATLLPGGKVLVVGGANNKGNILDNAELYDPTTGTWSVTGRLNAARVGHTATLLPNGQVLVVGGVNIQSILDVAELYDPGTGTWTRTGAPATNRFDHTATLLQTGKVLVAGGAYAGFVGVAELYDPATGSWSRTGRLITERAEHQATLLHDGRVLVTGGSYDADLIFPLSSAELYDPVAGTWSSASILNTARFLDSATLLPNGSVLVAGGDGPPNEVPAGCASRPSPSCFISNLPTNSAELFDPATGHWSSTGILNAARADHTATLLLDGEVLLAGGYSGEFLDINSAEFYDPISATWRNSATLNTARHGHTATLLTNGKVLVAGGSTGLNTNANSVLNSAELYEQAPSPGTIGPGFTGAWFDPSQSGHGLFIEVLTDNRLLAWWFTFNPAGTQQAWFGGVGTYSGNTATITAVDLPTGGRWIPNFDPNQIVRNHWGTLMLTFTDRDHGRVDFNSVLGYGTGSMNLTRLTQPAGLSAVSTSIGPVSAVTTDTSGNVYFSSPNLVFKLDNQGSLTRVAGNVTAGYSGDGGPATQALLNIPAIYPELVRDPIDYSELVGGLAVDATGNLYIADAYNNRVRKVNPNGIITTVAGDGNRGKSGDGGLATNARLWWPQGVAVDTAGKLYIADSNGTLRKVTSDGVITSLTTNNCGPDFLGPGLCAPEEIAVDANSNVFVTDGYCRVRVVKQDGSVFTVAGDDRNPSGGFSFHCGYSGDGGAATSAALSGPYSVAVDVSGNLYIADTYNSCIRKVNTVGVITTIAGACTLSGSSGDGGPPTSARLNLPHGVAVDTAGIVYVADTGNNRLRKISPHGTVTTVAGDGSTKLYEVATPGTIGPGFTGAWYDPAQSGHGLFIEVLTDNRLLAWWFTFNPAGTQQAWFGGVGLYSDGGNTATITAVDLPTGGRWIPNFDPNQIVRNPWGTLTFTFTDCNHGRVDFNSMQGYGTGSMNLTRLTLPAGLSCL